MEQMHTTSYTQRFVVRDKYPVPRHSNGKVRVKKEFIKPVFAPGARRIKWETTLLIN
jgi:hypothetical protein